MPAIAALTINDGASTPVTRTFAPISISGSKAEYADRSPTIPSGFRKIQHSVEQPSGQRTTYRVTDGFFFPTVATVNGVDTVVRYAAGKLVLDFSPESTVQERKDARSFIRNFLDEADIQDSIDNVEPMY